MSEVFMWMTYVGISLLYAALVLLVVGTIGILFTCGGRR